MSDVKVKVKEVETSASNAVATARTLEIRTRADMVRAVELIRAQMEGVDRVDEVLNEYVKPLESNIKQLKGWFKQPKTMFQTAIGAAKSKLYDAMKQDATQRAADEKKLAAEAQKKREDLLREASEARAQGDTGKAVELEVQAESMVEVSLHENVKIDGAYIRVTWKAEVTDMAEFVFAIASGDIDTPGLLKVDTTALNKIATATKGVKQMPGVRFYKEESLVVRR